MILEGSELPKRHWWPGKEARSPEVWAGIVLTVSFLLGVVLAVVVDRWYTPPASTFHVLESGK